MGLEGADVFLTAGIKDELTWGKSGIWCGFLSALYIYLMPGARSPSYNQCFDTSLLAWIRGSQPTCSGKYSSHSTLNSTALLSKSELAAPVFAACGCHTSRNKYATHRHLCCLENKGGISLSLLQWRDLEIFRGEVSCTFKSISHFRNF